MFLKENLYPLQKKKQKKILRKCTTIIIVHIVLNNGRAKENFRKFYNLAFIFQFSAIEKLLLLPVLLCKFCVKLRSFFCKIHSYFVNHYCILKIRFLIDISKIRWMTV
jgi:hypothetical protein